MRRAKVPAICNIQSLFYFAFICRWIGLALDEGVVEESEWSSVEVEMIGKSFGRQL